MSFRGRRKFTAAAPINPIVDDLLNDRPFTPTPESRRNIEIDLARNLSARVPVGIDPEVWRTSVQEAYAKKLTKDTVGRAGDLFKTRFHSWLVGRPYPQDRAKSLWHTGAVGANEEINLMSMPGVEEYVAEHRAAAVNFETMLSVLRELGPIGLTGEFNVMTAYLYFKYIVDGAGMGKEFESDWRSFQDVTNPRRHRLAEPDGERPPVGSAPPDAVAMSGRANYVNAWNGPRVQNPLMVTSSQVDPETGDPIGIQDLPGYGMVAVDNAHVTGRPNAYEVPGVTGPGDLEAYYQNAQMMSNAIGGRVGGPSHRAVTAAVVRSEVAPNPTAVEAYTARVERVHKLGGGHGPPDDDDAYDVETTYNTSFDSNGTEAVPRPSSINVGDLHRMSARSSAHFEESSYTTWAEGDSDGETPTPTPQHHSITQNRNSQGQFEGGPGTAPPPPPPPMPKPGTAPPPPPLPNPGNTSTPTPTPIKRPNMMEILAGAGKGNLKKAGNRPGSSGGGGGKKNTGPGGLDLSDMAGALSRLKKTKNTPDPRGPKPKPKNTGPGGIDLNEMLGKSRGGLKSSKGKGKGKAPASEPKPMSSTPELMEALRKRMSTVRTAARGSQGSQGSRSSGSGEWKV